MKQERRNWTRDELIVAFNLYCRMPFGQIRHGNPIIVRLAESLGRSPSALSMKMGNFARLDPAHQRRNVGGLSHGSKRDTEVWDEFHADWESLAYESEWALERLAGGPVDARPAGLCVVGRDGPTEASRSVRVRLVQRFFRDAVLSGYDYSCTVCQLRLPAMLNASHVIPWSVDESRRADPHNGLSLCAFHDRAFDRGFVTVDDEHRIVVSREARVTKPPKLHRVGLIEIEGKKIALPERFRPDPVALEYHRESVFLG